MAKLIEAVYGDALMETGKEKGILKQLLEEAEWLLEIFQANPELKLFLNHPRIATEEKVHVMEQVFGEAGQKEKKKSELSREMLGFLKVIVEKKRQDILDKILTYFADNVKEYGEAGQKEKKKSELSREMLGFLKVIVEKKRQDILDKILTYFADNVKEYFHIGVVFVAAPMELTADQKKAVEKKILETTSYETLEVHYQIDPSLIGGLVIRIRDKVADNSVKHKLERLKQQLVSM